MDNQLFAEQFDGLQTLRTQMSTDEPSFIYPDQVSERRLPERPVDRVYYSDLFGQNAQQTQIYQVEQPYKVRFDYIQRDVNQQPSGQQFEIEPWQDRIPRQPIKADNQIRISKDNTQQLPVYKQAQNVGFSNQQGQYQQINQYQAASFTDYSRNQGKVNRNASVQVLNQQPFFNSPQQQNLINNHAASNPPRYQNKYSSPTQGVITPNRTFDQQQQVYPQQVMQRNLSGFPRETHTNQFNNNGQMSESRPQQQHFRSNSHRKIFMQQSPQKSENSYQTPQRMQNQSLNYTPNVYAQQQQQHPTFVQASFPQNDTKNQFFNNANIVQNVPMQHNNSHSNHQNQEGSASSMHRLPGSLKKPLQVFQKIDRWPSIISNFKSKNSGFRAELECLCELTTESQIPPHCVRMKKRVEDLVEIGIDTILSIQKKIEHIRDNISSGDVENYSKEYYFSTDDKHNRAGPFSVKPSPDSMTRKGINVLLGQEQRIFDSLSEASRQLQLCQPTGELTRWVPSCVLEIWSARQLHQFRNLKDELRSNFSDIEIARQISKGGGVLNLLQNLASNHPQLSPWDRIQIYLNSSEDDQTNNFFKNLMRCILSCEEIIEQTQREIEGAVCSYEDFLNSSLVKLNDQLAKTRLYLRYVRQSQVALAELLLHKEGFNSVIKEADYIATDLQQALKLPFGQYPDVNLMQLQYYTSKKAQLSEFISQFVNQANLSRSQVLSFFEQEQFQAQLTTPLDEEIYSIQSLATKAQQKLSSFDTFLVNLFALREASSKAHSMYSNIEKWVVSNAERPANQQEVRQKIADIQNEISSLVKLRDSLEANSNMQQKQEQFPKEDANLILPILKEEHSGIVSMINQIHDFHDSLESSITHEYSFPASSSTPNNPVVFEKVRTYSANSRQEGKTANASTNFQRSNNESVPQNKQNLAQSSSYQSFLIDNEIEQARGVLQGANKIPVSYYELNMHRDIR